ncbi:MAG: HEAT repeat domain-containing protein [Candidatus Alcyoniella australis]|nr:HEAT repeat domain-containing protein [Candidatus Alcyoniella australis]
MALFGPPDIEKLAAARNLRGLVRALKRREHKLRAAAAKALGELEDPRAEQALLAALGDEHTQVVAAAASALGKIHATAAVEPLIALISSETEPQTLEAAARALARLGDERAVDALSGLLGSDLPSLNKAAEDALLALGRGIGAEHWIERRNFERCVELGEQAVQPLIVALQSEPLRSGAGAALVRIGEPALEPLLALLDQPHCAEILRRMGAKAVEGLISALHDQRLRPHAVVLLAQLGDQRAAGPLLELLDDPATATAEVYQALALLRHGPAAGHFVKALHGDDPAIALWAARALGELGDPSAIGPLIEALQGDDRELHAEAARSLGRLGDQRAVESLIRALQKPYLEEAAAWALGEIGDERALEPLRAVVEQTPEHIFCPAREPYERLLEQLGDTEK